MHSDRRDRHRHRSSHNEPDRDRDRERHRHKHHHRERNSKEEHGSPRGGPADRKVADDATVPMPMPMPAPPMPLAKPEDKDKGKDKDTEPKTSVAQFNSKTLNVSVLSASMNEHQQQIHRNLTGALVKFFHAVYAEAKKGSERQAPEGERLSDLRLFQEKLRGMPRWSQLTVDKVVSLVQSWIPNKRFNLAKVLKTLVVGRTMLLVSVASNDGAADKVKVEVPNVDNFLHAVICLVAENLFSIPSIVRVSKSEDERTVDMKTRELRAIIHDSIDNAILDLLPSESVNEYLDGAMEAEQFDAKLDAAKRTPAPAEDMSTYGFDRDEPKIERKSVNLPSEIDQVARATSDDRRDRPRHRSRYSDDDEEEDGYGSESPRSGSRSGSESGSPRSGSDDEDDYRRLDDRDIRSTGQFRKLP